MHPIKTDDATVLYKAPENMPECGDLWVHRIRPGVIRATYEPNEQELKLLKQGGRVQLTIAHEPIAPIMLEVMAEEVTRPVAEHPFRVDKKPTPKEASTNGSTKIDGTTDAAEPATQGAAESSKERQPTEAGDA